MTVSVTVFPFTNIFIPCNTGASALTMILSVLEFTYVMECILMLVGAFTIVPSIGILNAGAWRQSYSTGHMDQQQ